MSFKQNEKDPSVSQAFQASNFGTKFLPILLPHLIECSSFGNCPVSQSTLGSFTPHLFSFFLLELNIFSFKKHLLDLLDVISFAPVQKKNGTLLTDLAMSHSTWLTEDVDEVKNSSLITKEIL